MNTPFAVVQFHLLQLNKYGRSDGIPQIVDDRGDETRKNKNENSLSAPTHFHFGCSAQTTSDIIFIYL